MKISVCMAAYNGEKYIKEQISSILAQLNVNDELVIVNDCSVDSTLNIIQSFNDERIKVINNSQNLGLIKTFEISLINAVGDIIFLSDQDDIWLPGKLVKTVEHMLKTNAAAVVSDAIVIDDSGNVIINSFFEHRKSAPGLLKNFYKNSYIGCCMAIDAKFKKFILPFPSYIPMHDEWIGFTYEFLGSVEFLPEKLLAYRRHSNNQTNLYRHAWKKVILKRFKILRFIVIEFPKKWIKLNMYNS